MKTAVPGFSGPPADPIPFQVADPGKLRQALEDAGLEEVTVDTVTFGMKLPSARNLWDLILNSNPIGEVLVAGLTEDQRAQVQRTLEDMLSKRQDPNGRVVLNADINVGLGTKGGNR